jgi:hypothetical protein
MKFATLMLRIVAIGAMFLTASAFAQTPTALKAYVPYSFQAGDLRLPAGEYIMRFDILTSVLWIQGFDERKAFIVMTSPRHGDAARNAELRFRRYGNTYYLASVWNGPGAIGVDLSMSKAERETSKASAPVKVAALKAEPYR